MLRVLRLDRDAHAARCIAVVCCVLMLSACREGPPSARVDAVDEYPAAPEDAGEGGFEQRPTV